MPFFPKHFYLFITNTLKRVYIANYPHESRRERIFRKIFYLFLSLYEEFLTKKAKKTFVISPSTLEDVVTQYSTSKEKLQLIPCGLNHELFPKIKKPKHGFNFRLISVARFVPRKNIVDLVKIMNIIVRRDNKFVLHLVGGDGNSRYLRLINNLINHYDLSSNIQIHRNVSDEDLNQLYESCSLFLMTSLVEGFGLVLLEAMNKGLPVISYDVCGFRDIIINQKNGFLVEPFNYPKFAKKIIYLSKHRKIYNNFSKKALLRINNFSWDQSTNKIDRILKE